MTSGRARARVVVVALLAAAAGLVASRVSAQVPDTYGLGSRNVALAGSVTADVEDFTANYYNPAGLARTPHLSLGLGYFAAVHDFSIDGVPSHVDAVRGVVFGLVVPVTFDGWRFALGVAAHLGDERVSRSYAAPRTKHRWELYDHRPQRAFLAAHLAVEPVSWLRVGAGIAFLSDSATTLDLRGELAPFAADRETRLEHELVGDLTTIRYPQAGVQLDPAPWLSVGLVYRAEFSLSTSLDGEAIVDIVGAGDPIPGYLLLRTSSTYAFVPRQAALGVTVRPSSRWRLSADLTWVNWATYVSSIGSTDAILRIEVPPELADVIRVPGEIPSTRPIPAHFRDRFVPRVGVEHVAIDTHALALALRAGYFFENSPVPDQTGITNLVDCDRHTLTLGVGVLLRDLRPTLPGTLSLDVHLAASILPQREMHKASLVDRSGDYAAEGTIFAGGTTVEVAFE